MKEVAYQAIKKLLKTHVKEWKDCGGLGYIMAMIEGFVDNEDEAIDYVGEEED